MAEEVIKKTHTAFTYMAPDVLNTNRKAKFLNQKHTA